MARKHRPTVHERLRKAGPNSRPPTAREIAESLRTLESASLELEPDAFRVWACLADADISILGAGIAALGKKFGISRHTMQRALRKLVDAGYVGIEENKFARTAIYLKIALISQANNHFFKVGTTAFTLPPIPKAETREQAPILTILTEPEPSQRRRPKSAQDPAPRPTHLHAVGPDEQPQVGRTTEHLPKGDPAPRETRSEPLEPMGESDLPTSQPTEITEGKAARGARTPTGELPPAENDTRHSNKRSNRSSFKSLTGSKDLPSWSKNAHGRNLMVDSSDTSPAVESSRSPRGPELPSAALSFGTGPAAPEEGSSSQRSEDIPAVETSSSPSAATTGVDIAKLKSRSSPAARKAAERARLGAAAPVPLDLDRGPLPAPEVVYGFTVTGEDREKLLGHLARGARSKDKIATVAVLGNLAEEQYVAWRRKRLGDSEFGFLDNNHEKRWQKFAVACFQRGMRPVKVFDFWAEPTNNFTRLNNPHKSIPFICGIAQVEAANDEAGSKRPRGAQAPPVPVDAMHAFLGKNLHPQLRQTLEDAGHDVSEKTDDALMTVQVLAKDFAKGRMHVFAPAPIPERAKVTMHLFKEVEQ